MSYVGVPLVKPKELIINSLGLTKGKPTLFTPALLGFCLRLVSERHLMMSPQHGQNLMMSVFCIFWSTLILESVSIFQILLFFILPGS